jgi:hypothetical protein
MEMQIENKRLEDELAESKVRVEALRTENERYKRRQLAQTYYSGSRGAVARCLRYDSLDSGPLTPGDSDTNYSRASSVASAASPECYDLDVAVDWAMFGEEFQGLQDAGGTGMVQGVAGQRSNTRQFPLSRNATAKGLLDLRLWSADEHSNSL